MKQLRYFILSTCLILLFSTCDELLAPPNSIEWEYKFRDDDRISEIITPGGHVTSFEYNFDQSDSTLLTSFLKVNPDGEEVTYTYDEFGSLISMQDEIGIETYQYDGYGRVAGIQKENLPLLQYSYNSLNQVKTVQIGESYEVHYQYDFLNRLKAMVTPAGVINYEFRPSEAIIQRTFPNGISTIWKYQPDGLLESLSHTGVDAKLIQSYSYKYSADGLITEIQEVNSQGKNVKRYDYDVVKRLVSYSDSNGETIRYEYDKMGNRTSVVKQDNEQSFEYDQLGRLTAIDEIPSKIDDAGNLVKYSLNDENLKCKFDKNNRIVSSKNVEYVYDGNNRLVQRIESENLLIYKNFKYISDPSSSVWKPYIEYEEDNVNKVYLWQGETPIAEFQDGNWSFYLNDHLGSVTMETDESGIVIKENSYGPYGQTNDHSDFTPGFSGLFHEPSCDLILTANRVYNPSLGRFHQMDPAIFVPDGSQKELGVFVYCGSDPVNYYDPVGLQAVVIPSLVNPLPSGVPVPFGQLPQLGLPLPGQFGPGDMQGPISPPSARPPTTFGTPATPRRPVILGTPPVPNRPTTSINVPAPPLGTDIFNSKNEKPTSGKRGIFGGGFGQGARGLPGQIVQGIGAGMGIIFGGDPIGNEDPDNAPPKWGSEPIGLPPIPIGEPTGTIDYPNPKDNPGPIRPPGKPGQGSRGQGHKPPHLGPKSHRSQSMRNSNNIGGVYLKGIAQGLIDNESLSGIAIDESTGRLAILSDDHEEYRLPPLRLEDIVTIFDCVYNDPVGAPYVSIDPHPQNPDGDLFVTRHSLTTENTYVGWILYEADRVMKTYTLGIDNESKEILVSNISDYPDIRDNIFNCVNSNSIHERFWIVPDTLSISESSGQLLVCDIRLAVKTQRMDMVKGKEGFKLQPSKYKSTPCATKFSEWFTNNYDAIASESYSRPPSGFGVDSLIPIFKELERIALISAFAETMRENGIPFPAWMRDYQVEPFYTPATTKRIEVRNNLGTRIIHGGVGLTLYGEDKVSVQRNSREDNILRNRIFAESEGQPPFLRRQVDERKYVTMLPEKNSRVPGANMLEVLDLAVNLQNGGRFELKRFYNSFSTPDKELGKYWTFNLPLLESHRGPTISDQRDFSQAKFYLSNSLGTVWNQLDSSIIPNTLALSNALGFRMGNGQICYFEQLEIKDAQDKIASNKTAYRLQAIEDNNYTAHFSWNNSILEQITLKSTNGQEKEILFESDKSSEVLTAIFCDDRSVLYSYNQQGNLSQVKSQGVTTSYKYTDRFISEIWKNEKREARFDHNSIGQIVHITDANEIKTEFEYQVVDQGYMIKQIQNSDSINIFYNHEMVPLYAEDELGKKVDLNTDPKGNTHSPYEISFSSDGLTKYIQVAYGGEYEIKYDRKGNVNSIKMGEEVIYRREELKDNIVRIETENSEYLAELDEHGIVKSATFSGKNGRSNEFLSVNMSDLGYALNYHDGNGSFLGELKIHKKLNKAIWTDNFQTVNYHYEVDKNHGSVEYSWGMLAEVDLGNGQNISKIGLKRDSTSTSATFENGRVKRTTQYDGGEFHYHYKQLDSLTAISKVVAPNELVIIYDYNPDHSLSNVRCETFYNMKFKEDNTGRVRSIILDIHEPG